MLYEMKLWIMMKGTLNSACTPPSTLGCGFHAGRQPPLQQMVMYITYFIKRAASMSLNLMTGSLAVPCHAHPEKDQGAGKGTRPSNPLQPPRHVPQEQARESPDAARDPAALRMIQGGDCPWCHFFS